MAWDLRVLTGREENPWSDHAWFWLLAAIGWVFTLGLVFGYVYDREWVDDVDHDHPWLVGTVAGTVGAIVAALVLAAVGGPEAAGGVALVAFFVLPGFAFVGLYRFVKPRLLSGEVESSPDCNDSSRGTGSASDQQPPAGVGNPTGEPDGQGADGRPEDPMELLSHAESRVADARQARTDRKYDEALAALEDAAEHRERAEAAADQELGAAAELDSRIEDLRNEVEAERETIQELVETLENAESLLAEGDEAFDDGDTVVARLRYRQARDVYDRARGQAEAADLEPLNLRVAGKTFETVEDVDARRREAEQGHDASK